MNKEYFGEYQKEYSKKYRKNNKEKIKNKNKIYYKENYRLKKYNLTEDEFQEIFRQQQGLCAICKRVKTLCYVTIAIVG